jgi:iron complex transport system ATP-binding protein
MVTNRDGDVIFASDKAPLLHVEGVTFGYARQPLLYDVDVRVRSGEMIGLLGPNGSGKTTLLRLISGVLRPWHGKVLLEGGDLRHWSRRSIAQRIAVVPQELHMPFAFTVEHMVSLGRAPYMNFFGSPGQRDSESVEGAMQAATITPLADRVFNELSGGERQRVMIAMALAQDPKLLLLDEPTSHLDIKYQIETLELVQHLNRAMGVTVIAALHDLNLAARYFPRLLLFQRGIVADAGPAEVLEPGMLSRVYGVNVQVGILRGAEHLSVLPPGSNAAIDEDRQAEQPKVHIMSGGGSGELLMRALADVHIPFVAGALNIGDSDHTLALRLASRVITEQPYTPISPTAVTAVRASLAQARVAILCPMPIGPGNLALLQEALHAAQNGLPIIMFVPGAYDDSEMSHHSHKNDENIKIALADRDYTGGEGLKLLEELLQSGAIVLETVGEVVECIKCYFK